MPRFDSLKMMLSGILRHFLTLNSSEATVTGGGGERALDEGGEVKLLSPLEIRMAMLEQHIKQLPRNVEDRHKLVEHGYSERLWDQVSSMASLVQRVSCFWVVFVAFLSFLETVSVSEDGWLS